MRVKLRNATLALALGAWLVAGTSGGQAGHSGLWPDAAVADAAALTQSPANLSALKDNTLFEHSTDSRSNGVGQYFIAGRTGGTGGGLIRRGLIAFDIAAGIPAGATIDSVSLTLHLSNSSLRAPNPEQTVELHKALADWGEGTSNASTDIGRGAPATTNDATWLHRFFDSQEWNTPGGDFSSTVSVSTTVGATLGFYTWSSTPEMVADVQGWLDNPPGNFGWLVKGNESQTNTAKRFDTRENTTIANRPVLSIQFTSGVDTDAPAAPTNLVATAGDRQVVLDWDDNIELDLVGYNVYRSTTQGVQGAKITQSLVPGGASEYTDSGLPVGVEQFYMVTAVDESGNESDASSQVGATPFDGPPAAPTNLVARGGDRQVDLDWDDSPDPELAGYFVYRSLTSGGAYTRLTQSPITASQYLDTGLVALSVYRYVVTAVDAGGNESAVSTEASATTFPAPTPIPSISTAGMLVLALAGATAITWLT